MKTIKIKKIETEELKRNIEYLNNELEKAKNKNDIKNILLAIESLLLSISLGVSIASMVNNKKENTYGINNNKEAQYTEENSEEIHIKSNDKGSKKESREKIKTNTVKDEKFYPIYDENGNELSVLSIIDNDSDNYDVYDFYYGYFTDKTVFYDVLNNRYINLDTNDFLNKSIFYTKFANILKGIELESYTENNCVFDKAIRLKKELGVVSYIDDKAYYYEAGTLFKSNYIELNKLNLEKMKKLIK